MVQWGDPIPVDGQQPTWLADSDECQCRSRATGRWLACVKNRAIWENLTHIRLPVDHWAYPAIQKGFTPWQGGEAAPDDWDGGQVLLRDGDFINHPFATSANWMRGLDGDPTKMAYLDIIGYRKRTEPEAVETLKQAAPASFRGPVSIGAALKPFKWGDPVKPAPQPSITPEFIALVVTERDGLRKRVTDLLNANNREVELKREAVHGLNLYRSRCRDLEAEFEKLWSSFEQSQDDLATLRAEADERVRAMMSPPPTQAVPTDLTITITGPQGCGKTVLAKVLRHVFTKIGARHINGGGESTDLPLSTGEMLRNILTDRDVTIIDTETPPPAPDVVAEEAPEYVFGPWMAPCARPIGSYVQIRNVVLCRTFPVSQVKISEPQEDSIQGRLSDCMTRAAYRIGEWHPHHPGEMPVTGDTQVQVCTRSGDIQPAARADEFEWESLTSSVVAFRPVAAPNTATVTINGSYLYLGAEAAE